MIEEIKLVVTVSINYRTLEERKEAIEIAKKGVLCRTVLANAGYKPKSSKVLKIK